MKPPAKIVISIIIFSVAMIGMTIVCTALWDELLNGKVYGCSDGGNADYWMLSWAGIGNGNYSVATVKTINITSMSDPDELKEGWSVARLWSVWYSFFGASLMVSFFFASLPWWKIRCAPSSIPLH
jgi:hypothetical protein